MASMPSRIRKARLRAKLSQSELARQVGVQRSATGQWEQSDGTTPSVANLARTAAVTGVAFEWLATGRGPMDLAASDDHGGLFRVDAVAQDITEERLLAVARRLTQRKREALVELLELVIR